MIKILSDKSLTNKQIRFFIVMVIFINGLGLFSPVLSSNDSYFYAVVAKHIALSNDFINLTFNGQDWLDKPHFPFWVTAISYKLFGINPFAYVLPGFLFYVLGGGYLYLLAKHIFASKEVGLLSALIYFSSLHLMISGIDIRQEAFLLGEIIPASYYWVLYDESETINLKYLLLGGLFSALAVMTKGIFVLLIIFSGLVGVGVFTKKSRKIICKKWLLAGLLIAIFILPELICLYLQFDLHPDKVVFGKTHVSGIKWFFWDSQFGRFFNSGPITSNKSGGVAHYFYYVHTLLWAFLPWSLVAFFAFSKVFKSVRLSKEVPESVMRKKERANYIYLLLTIIPTFILFSLTNFQLDHYTNILIPFLAILCADYLFNNLTKLSKHPLFTIQIGLSYTLCGLVLVLALIIFRGKLFVGLVLCELVIVMIFLLLSRNYPLTKALVFPIISICLVFGFVEVVNGKLYSQYDLGYQVNKYLKNQHYPMIDYNVNSLSLEFHTNNSYKRIGDINQLLVESTPFYLAINKLDWNDIVNTNKSRFESSLLLNNFKLIGQEKFIPSLFNAKKMGINTKNILLILVK